MKKFKLSTSKVKVVVYRDRYLITEKGEVWTLTLDGQPNKKKNFIYNNCGYTYCDFGEGKKQERISLSRLVYELFIGPVPVGCIVAHRDNDNQNNHKDNLLAITQSENLILINLSRSKPSGIKKIISLLTGKAKFQIRVLAGRRRQAYYGTFSSYQEAKDASLKYYCEKYPHLAPKKLLKKYNIKNKNA